MSRLLSEVFSPRTGWIVGYIEDHTARPLTSDEVTAHVREHDALRAENERLAGALRHCARELQYVLDADPCEQREVHQSGEAQACVALAESLLGPMRDWPEEPNASARAAASPSAPDGGGGERG